MKGGGKGCTPGRLPGRSDTKCRPQGSIGISQERKRGKNRHRAQKQHDASKETESSSECSVCGECRGEVKQER